MRSWNPTTADAVTADAGSLLYVPFADGDASNYCTQRLTFVGVRQPQLSFYYKLESGTLTVKAWLPDGSEVPLCQLQSGAAQAATWHFATADFTDLKPQPYVVVKFMGTGDAGTRLFVDDVLICDEAYTNGISHIDHDDSTVGGAIEPGTTISGLRLHGLLSEDDVHTLATMTVLKSIDLSDAAFEGDLLPPYAFYGCRNLRTLLLPRSMRFYGDGALAGCSNLNRLDIPEGDGQGYALRNGVPYSPDTTEVIYLRLQLN